MSQDVLGVRAEARRDARVRAVPEADDRQAGEGRRPLQGHAARQDEEPPTGKETKKKNSQISIFPLFHFGATPLPFGLAKTDG